MKVSRVIHSIDRLELISAIEKRLCYIKENQKRENPDHSDDAKFVSVDGFLQFNISKEQSKAGFLEEELEGVVEAIAHLRHTRLVGLMTMAPFTEDTQMIRACFSGLKKVQKKLVAQIKNYNQGQLPAHLPLKYLSMGMSNDYQIAIEEGATHIRVGSAIFDGNI